MDLIVKSKILKKVNNALDSIRPHLIADGGDVKVVDISEDMVVKIEWIGNCKTCAMSFMTLNGGIKYSILNNVSEIKDVVEINDPLK